MEGFFPVGFRCKIIVFLVFSWFHVISCVSILWFSIPQIIEEIRISWFQFEFISSSKFLAISTTWEGENNFLKLLWDSMVHKTTNFIMWHLYSLIILVNLFLVSTSASGIIIFANFCANVGLNSILSLVDNALFSSFFRGYYTFH